VGGGVRDLLLGKKPKDFDLATSATPEQVRASFRRCRLIGRRFRLAHVLVGREMIEVATFRGQGENDGTHHHLENGRIIRDNLFGTVEEDALRRDFTINALFLDVSDWTIRDFVGGYQDLKSGTLKLIGDPQIRYREDPVRLLRAARFIAKLDLQVDAKTAAPLSQLGVLLHGVPPARLFEEVNKLFLTGHAEQSLNALQHHGLMRFLFPLSPLAPGGKRIAEDAMLIQAMQNTDSRIREKKPVTPAFLYAVLLWSAVRERAGLLKAKNVSPADALRSAGEEVMLGQIKTVAIPRRFGSVSREIWSMQPRFHNQKGRRAQRLLGERRFRAAYDFLLLRAEIEPELQDLADFWTEIQEMSPEQQHRQLQIQQSGKPRRQRNRSRRVGRVKNA